MIDKTTKMFHHSSLAALMSGLYEGSITISELLEHGDFGIGTLAGITGEVIILDGEAYQARADNTVSKLTGSETAPYGAVTPFTKVLSFEVENAINSELLTAIETQFSSKNLFHAIKLEGSFDSMHVRMSPGGKEGEPFVEIAARQPEYTEKKITGTIVGFWTPELFHGVSAAGYHLHFLSQDKQFGGHIIDFEGFSGNVEIGKIDQLLQSFPTENRNFLEAQLDLDKLRADITEAE